MRIIKSIFFILVTVVISACSSTPTYTIQIHDALENRQTPKQLALFLDGTQNDRDSRTNVSALSEIVKHQDLDNLYMFYNEGVGTGGKVIGAGTGWGMGKDIAEAYSFLTQYYTPNSKLYIFGFSRGAYTSRILAGMIYSLGVYDLSKFDRKDQNKISFELYSAYKGSNNNLDTMRLNANKIIETWVEKHKEKGILVSDIKWHENVEIDALGIWDTVEALGVVPTIEAIALKVFGTEDPLEIENPNGRYLDQVCNIKNVYHALSLDDNRANVFTPIIISGNHVTSKCNRPSINKNIHEVWFSGAHADVGGGYEKNENNKKNIHIDRDISLPGISMNWMMSHLKKDTSLLSYKAEVYENPKGYSHNARNGTAKYKEVSRDSILVKYLEYSKDKTIKIHSSVLQRLKLSKKERESLGYDSGWYKLDILKSCFTSDNEGHYVYRKCSEIEVIPSI